jgi:hypothetical protein
MSTDKHTVESQAALASIDDLVVEITADFEHAQGRIAEGVSGYVSVGDKLIRLKAELKALEGSKFRWEPWVDASDLPFGHRQAQKYMRLAKRSKELLEKAPLSSDNLNELLAILVEGTRPKKAGKPRPKQKGTSPEGEPFEFDVPDLAYMVRHLGQQWPAVELQRYQPGPDQLEILSDELPLVLTGLVELAERHDIDTGEVRIVEPVQSMVLDGNAVNVTDAVLIEGSQPSPRDLFISAFRDAPKEERIAEVKAVMVALGVTQSDLSPELKKTSKPKLPKCPACSKPIREDQMEVLNEDGDLVHMDCIGAELKSKRTAKPDEAAQAASL